MYRIKNAWVFLAGADKSRGSGWWSQSCQNVSILYLQGIGLLYMQTCNHFKFDMYGAVEERASYMVRGERERIQSDSAVFLQCIKEKPSCRGTGTQLPLSESLGNPYGALSLSHSAFGKIVGLNEVMQKIFVETDFQKYLFPRNWKDLGSSGSFSWKWKTVPYS